MPDEPTSRGASDLCDQLGPLVEAADMVSLLNHGAASCVYSEGCHGVTQEHLERFAELVRAKERERCAKLCEDIARRNWSRWDQEARPEDQGAATAADELAELMNTATAEGRNFYYEGQHDAEDEADAARRLALVHERDALREMVTWAYSKMHGRTFNSLDDALELDRLKLYVEHGALA